jgi:dTDP-4-amino-4,6-dideoxygalactose transaminase
LRRAELANDLASTDAVILHAMNWLKERDELAASEPEPWTYDIEELGMNYRITDFQCALGSCQLAKLENWTRRRQEIAGLYRQALEGCRDLELPPCADWCTHGYHLFVNRVPASRRREIFNNLREQGLSVQVHYIPVNMLAAYQNEGHRPDETPVALSTYERVEGS